jgi:MinD superfamily P-loop ATPase
MTNLEKMQTMSKKEKDEYETKHAFEICKISDIDDCPYSGRCEEVCKKHWLKQEVSCK